ncbi:hypothetical protein [Pararhodobacter zhoushanensis]|uniref:Uncharacterized protein n=1 Tax=Pararhodobacter zhoushanensis TaxID=2479545 RepID=A0ABT3GXM3_9RHOB|nr:hypothetical protein [Pararhodobacter zhoushanensis]MCW1932271.1 hypothetical protein [Pararhodobacter zhoushanensis]
MLRAQHRSRPLIVQDLGVTQAEAVKQGSVTTLRKTSPADGFFLLRVFCGLPRYRLTEAETPRDAAETAREDGKNGSAADEDRKRAGIFVLCFLTIWLFEGICGRFGPVRWIGRLYISSLGFGR